MHLLISPTEPPTLRALGKTSSTPEKYGVDVFWAAQGLSWGIQRKEVSDFVASVYDGRLNKELSQMQMIDRKILILEGVVSWDANGELRLFRRRGGGKGFTQSQFLSTILSVQLSNCWMLTSTDLPTTCEFVSKLRNWSEIPDHKILTSRPKPTAEWGFRSNRDWGIHLLQSFPGIGPGVAAAIYDHFGGVPLQWEITAEQLTQVKGVGKERARALIQGLQNPNPTTPTTNSPLQGTASVAANLLKSGSDIASNMLSGNSLPPPLVLK